MHFLPFSKEAYIAALYFTNEIARLKKRAIGSQLGLLSIYFIKHVRKENISARFYFRKIKLQIMKGYCHREKRGTFKDTYLFTHLRFCDGNQFHEEIYFFLRTPTIY